MSDETNPIRLISWDLNDIPPQERLSEALRRAIEISGVQSDKEFAELAGIPWPNITNVLQMRVPLTLDEIQRVARVSGYDAKELFRASQEFTRTIFAPEENLKHLGEPTLQVRSVTDDGRFVQEAVRFENFASRAVIALRQITNEAMSHIERLRGLMEDLGISEPGEQEVTCLSCKCSINRVYQELDVYVSELPGGETLYKPKRCSNLKPGQVCPNGNRVGGDKSGN